MKRVLVLVAVGVLGLAGCGKHAEKRVAVPVASAGTGLPPVPQTTTPQAASAAPTSHAAAPAHKRKAEPSRTAADAGGAGSGNAGLDEFVAAVQRQLPEVALDRRDEEVEDLGKRACHGLAAGEKDAAVAAEISDQGVALPDARKLVTLARGTVCGGRPKV